MKATLQHLSLERRELIKQVVEVVRETVNPEMIVLFGSYAKGTLVEQRYVSQGTIYDYTSDIDLLVITRGSTAEPSELHFQVFNRTESLRPSVNMEIHEIDYVNEALEFGQYFFTDIIKEGIILFDNGTIQFAEPRELSPLELKQISQQYFDSWFATSKGFLKTAKFDLAEHELKIGIFVLHQAVESFYYTVLLVFTGYKPKTHNLYKLRKTAKPSSELLFDHFPIEKDKDQRDLYDLLKRAYLEARYNSEYIVTEQKLKTLIAMVDQMQPIVEKICLEKIASLTNS